jgi:hypothetical protein
MKRKIIGESAVCLVCILSGWSMTAWMLLGIMV